MKRTKAADTRVLRETIVLRADGRCECCTMFVGQLGEMDHFFGRAKVEQSVETCWYLCRSCHRDKTDNKPIALVWVAAFMAHCRAHGYSAALDMAAKKGDWLQAKARA